MALGVANHSNFRRATLTRLQHTLDAIYTITFSPRRDVELMAEHVRRRHATVRGDSPQRYSAFSPDAQLWVVATLIQLSVVVFERYVGPLTATDRSDFLRDMRVFGTFFGLAESYGPQNWEAFSAYYEEMLTGDLLGSLPVSRELADHIVRPRCPFVLRTLWPASRHIAREFLPSPLRERLGYSAPSGLATAAVDTALRTGIPLLPDGLRFAPQYLLARSHD